MAIAADKNASGEFGPVAGALIALQYKHKLVRINFDFFLTLTQPSHDHRAAAVICKRNRSLLQELTKGK